MAGALAGGQPALPENLRPGRVVNNALAFIIDPNRVAGPEWQTLTDAVLDHVADTPPAPGSDGVSIPGEPEALHRMTAMDRGIALDPDTVAALHRIGGGLGLDVKALLEG